MIRVVFCTNGIFPYVVGGMQRHSRLLIEALSDYSNIDIVVIHPHKETIFSQLNIREITIKGMDSSQNYLLERYRYSKRVYHHLQSLSDYIIYSQGPSVWYKAGEFKSRLIINPHGLEPFQGITLKEKGVGLPFRIILRYLFKKARYVVSLGGRLTDILEPFVRNWNHLIELPNAVSKPKASTEEKNIRINNPLRALFVGRFASNKGIHLLMDTISELNKKGFEDKIEFYLAGKGPLYEKYNSSNSHGNVHILGFVSDEELEHLYQNSDLFVLPTLFEGMPTVVLEAMSYALPVIVADVGATAELVSDSNGFLIEKDNTEQLKNVIIQFIKLSNTRKKELGSNSLAKVKKEFTWDTVAKAHIDLFNDLQNELDADG